jgi:hypothetical protein
MYRGGGANGAVDLDTAGGGAVAGSGAVVRDIAPAHATNVPDATHPAAEGTGGKAGEGGGRGKKKRNKRGGNGLWVVCVVCIL